MRAAGRGAVGSDAQGGFAPLRLPPRTVTLVPRFHGTHAQGGSAPLAPPPPAGGGRGLGVGGGGPRGGIPRPVEPAGRRFRSYLVVRPRHPTFRAAVVVRLIGFSRFCRRPTAPPWAEPSLSSAPPPEPRRPRRPRRQIREKPCRGQTTWPENVPRAPPVAASAPTLRVHRRCRGLPRPPSPRASGLRRVRLAGLWRAAGRWRRGLAGGAVGGRGQRAMRAAGRGAAGSDAQGGFAPLRLPPRTVTLVPRFHGTHAQGGFAPLAPPPPAGGGGGWALGAVGLGRRGGGRPWPEGDGGGAGNGGLRCSGGLRPPPPPPAYRDARSSLSRHTRTGGRSPPGPLASGWRWLGDVFLWI